jgi:hypothetical protein
MSNLPFFSSGYAPGLQGMLRIQQQPGLFPRHEGRNEVQRRQRQRRSLHPLLQLLGPGHKTALPEHKPQQVHWRTLNEHCHKPEHTGVNISVAYEMFNRSVHQFLFHSEQ